MLYDTYYKASRGTIQADMDHYDIPRTCEQCQHFMNNRGGICSSVEMREDISGMMGVTFDAIALGVKPDTDASLCDSWNLTDDPEILGALEQDIEEAAIEARRNADHYTHLRRHHAY